MTTTFYLVRHGLTDHTGHRLSGWTPDVHLSEAGLAQAEATADSLERIPLAAVYASPLERTVETARVIASRHRLRVRTRRDVGEVDFGQWTNRSFRTLERTRRWRAVQRWPSGVRFPGGESLLEVQSRALAALEELCAVHPRQSVCVVCHAEVIRLVAAHFLGVHVDLFQRIVVAPGSITVVVVGGNGPLVLGLNLPPGSPLEAAAPPPAHRRAARR